MYDVLLMNSDERAAIRRPVESHRQSPCNSKHPSVNLNARAAALCRSLADDAQRLRIQLHLYDSGAMVVDCGVKAPGGLEAGLLLARVCMADLGTIEIEPSGDGTLPVVQVRTDQPLLACMASQYAGWEIKADGFFAMGSGPMRAAAAREPLFEDINYREKAPGFG